MDGAENQIQNESLISSMAEVVSDPSRLWLFFVPVGLFLLILITIGFLRWRNRQQLKQSLNNLEVVTPTKSSNLISSVGVKISEGLQATRDHLVRGLSDLFYGSPQLDEDLANRVRELLYRSDLGVKTSQKLVDSLRQSTNSEPLTLERVKEVLTSKISDIFDHQGKSFELSKDHPTVILIVGVNGAGKTTTIAKIASHFLAQDKSVLLCAADTYRAGAIDQLGIWAQRLGIEMVAHAAGADPAAVAFDGVKAALSRNIDVLLVDTAGRLHSKTELMDELSKVNRIIGRALPGAPHETWLVLDATTGQNGLAQVQAFGEAVKLTGMVVTKLDGTARGGVVVAAVDRFQIPVRFVGVGEKASDLRPFSGRDFATSLFY